ncbi:hypothetical protein PGT21_029292 [Puccinia graminis f. sp. tritici]|uniref:C2H2-type domain-containing protein n=1 Tax=Puccinia graminis f. sp. tritici TaxID=56615 RepID=A0A5B0PER3_PUCGR|nr:hypothetical protein PGT21_029292 [Puccinia graminis f. sp. tritici]KAA1128178.1 hypothetical protein PGTUg99_019831 [Puccinia graminis f. sp. tritici]
MTPSSVGHQFIHRQSLSSQDGLYSNNNINNNNQELNTAQVTTSTTNISIPISLAPYPTGGISSDFNPTRPPLDFGQSHTNHNHGLDNTSNNIINHPTRVAGQPDDPHLSHSPMKKLSAQKTGNHHHKRTYSHPAGSDKKKLTGSRANQSTAAQSTPEISKNNAQQASPAANPPLKKNGKPLAKCPFCGMTFKKLEHCQRHERTHTLARPYSCTVCMKTFARQDTLNRHLRLHSRSDSKMAINKSAPAQPSQTPASPSKQPPRNLLSSPIRSNFDMLSVSGVPQPSTFASPPHIHRRIARERGLSLSALEQLSLPSHLARDPSMINNGPRQSISLPLQRHHEQFAHPHHNPAYPFQYNQAPPPSSQLSLEISSQPSESSASYVYGESIEARRGSWCPGGQNWNELTLLPPEDPGPPPPSTRGYRHQPQHLSLGVANWSKNLTNTFGLVEAGIGPIPQSAPATCTNWGTPLIGSGAPENTNATAGSLVGPRWETFSQYESQPQIHPSWSGLGRLDEEEQIKMEPEPSINSAGTSQLLLSSPSQPGSFDQPGPFDQSNPIENNGPTGSTSTEISHEPQSESNPSVHWSFPVGGNLSDQYLGQLAHPTSFTSSSDPVDCFGNVWQSAPKNLGGVGSFHPGYWNPTACADNQDGHPTPIGDSGVLNPNGLPTKNPWQEIVEFDF